MAVLLNSMETTISAPVTDVKKVISGYNKVDGKYKPYYHPEYTYNKEFETIFPRMYSSDPDHESAYKYWGKVVGRKYSAGSEKKHLVFRPLVKTFVIFSATRSDLCI